MDLEHLLRRAREAAGMSQAELASAAETSRSTLSAYEHGRKSPTLATASRILRETGLELALAPKIEFTEIADERGRPIVVPSALPRLPLDEAFATVRLPLHVQWWDADRRYNLSDRQERARVYEIVLREGRPSDVLAYVDGALLIDQWEELVLPSAVRRAWGALVDRAAGNRAA